MNKRVQVAKYLIFDWLAAAGAWSIFFIYRKLYIEPQHFGSDVPLVFTNQFVLGLIFLPAAWVLFYYITGYYSNVYRKSRLIELGQTFFTAIVGVTTIFFTLLLDDIIGSYKNYYNLYSTLFLLHFGLTYCLRLIQTSRIIHRIHSRKFGFNTLLIGGDEKAVQIFKEMDTQTRPAGFKFVGFLSVEENDNSPLEEYIPNLGTINDFTKISQQYDLEEVIIAIESSQHKLMTDILTSLQNRTLTVWGIPDLFDLLSGSTKTNVIFSSPLIKISNGIMPAWQENMKRLIDVAFSVLFIVIFAPVFLLIAILIKTGSKGPVLYRQVRVGKFGRPFTIYKFRTMFVDAENNGPELSSDNDPRITPLGQFLRRTHLDEIPQFYNVIRGEMSIVGPRPERKYFIDQIVAVAPYYTQLHKIRPGITSWGQVKYGYASNLDEMLERLPYDIVYLKNISLYIDFKILIYTVMTCFKGDGK
ncbi:MAG TPA: sugar transferase [Sunxiuqinia sp.]|nr:sugar transferase [Sunxiuqinia sp.]